MAAVPAYAGRYFGSKDMTIIHSVVDVAGLNPLLKDLLARAAGAICGMVEASSCDTGPEMDGAGKVRVGMTEFKFSETVVIGRADDCDVRVFDEAASRHHAVVRREGDDYVAVDQESLNGLYVNGRRVERHVLKTGDEITVRNLTLVFVAEGATDRPTVISDRLSIQYRKALARQFGLGAPLTS